MTRNEFTLLYTVMKHGMASHRTLRDLTGLSTGYISQTLKAFAEQGLVDAEGLTEEGRLALQPYKVDNAVIMAARMSPGSVPLRLGKPEGLLLCLLDGRGMLYIQPRGAGSPARRVPWREDAPCAGT